MAHGGNAEEDEPGQGPRAQGPDSDAEDVLNGKVTIDAADVNLNWDPRFMPSLLELQPESDISFLTLRRQWVNYPSK